MFLDLFQMITAAKIQMRPLIPNQTRAVLLAVLILTSGAGCKVRLISDYDEITDTSATQLQKKVEGFVHKMVSLAGTPAGTFTQNAAFYDEARTDLSAIRVRAKAFEKNDLTIQEIDLVQKGIDDLQALHKIGGDRGLRSAVADPALSALNTQFTALIKLELAKKRGQ